MGLLSPIEAALHGLLSPNAAPPAGASNAAMAAPTGAGMVAATNYMHPTRDAILRFLGGAAGRLADTLDQNDLIKYGAAQNQRIYEALADHPELQRAFLIDPPGVKAALAKNFEPQNIHKGDSVQYMGPGGRMITAPEMGIASGRGYTQTPDATRVTGVVGPDIHSEGDAIVDRNAVVGGANGVISQTPKAPEGYDVGPDGKTLMLKPGYLGGQQALALTRRQVVVNNPMPTRAGAGARGPADKRLAGMSDAALLAALKGK